MSTLVTQEVKESLFTLFTETFESGKNPDGTVYLDRGAGLLDTVADLSAEQASQQIYGTTIAAHINHSLFYLKVLERVIHGDTTRADWQESWQLSKVDEVQWNTLRNEVRVAYQRICELLNRQEAWEDGLEAGFDVVIHSAYHLGAIRQMVKILG